MYLASNSESIYALLVFNPLAIELRRPSILRASGHTFEYLGYGPGNYSTALPQLQVRQLPDDEVYLVQSQELSCGQVVVAAQVEIKEAFVIPEVEVDLAAVVEHEHFAVLEGTHRARV